MFTPSRLVGSPSCTESGISSLSLGTATPSGGPAIETRLRAAVESLSRAQQRIIELDARCNELQSQVNNSFDTFLGPADVAAFVCTPHDGAIRWNACGSRALAVDKGLAAQLHRLALDRPNEPSVATVLATVVREAHARVQRLSFRSTKGDLVEWTMAIAPVPGRTVLLSLPRCTRRTFQHRWPCRALATRSTFRAWRSVIACRPLCAQASVVGVAQSVADASDRDARILELNAALAECEARNRRLQLELATAHAKQLVRPISDMPTNRPFP
jgi:hypothetical protein